MHPLDDVRKGELLVKQVYEAIRAVPAVWGNSALLIVFDEHGGFYDHVTPPSTPPPGDDPINAASGQTPFGFDQLGVRVPAIIVSPLIPKGVIDHTIYDHTSALATLERQHSMDPLTHRDEKAQDFAHLFSLATARTDTPLKLVNPAAAAAADLVAKPQDTAESLKRDLASLETTQETARAVDERPVSGPQVGFAYVGLMRALSQASTEEEKAAWKKEFEEIYTPRDAARFMTRAKLKVGFGEYVPWGTGDVGK
jgi:phospholipase C